MIYCVLVEEIVIFLDNLEGFQKVFFCVSLKFVRYIRYGVWDMELLVFMIVIFIKLVLGVFELE